MQCHLSNSTPEPRVPTDGLEDYEEEGPKTFVYGEDAEEGEEEREVVVNTQSLDLFYRWLHLIAMEAMPGRK